MYCTYYNVFYAGLKIIDYNLLNYNVSNVLQSSECMTMYCCNELQCIEWITMYWMQTLRQWITICWICKTIYHISRPSWPYNEWESWNISYLGKSTLNWYQISTLSWYQISVYRNKASKVRINCILTSPFECMCVRLNLHNKGTFFHWATFLHPVTLDDFSQWRGLFNGKPAHCCCFQKLEAFTGRHFSAKLLIENFKCALIRRQNNENLAFWYLTACSLTPTYLTPCNLAPGKWLLTLSVVGMKLKLLCRKLAWGAWPDQDQFIQIGSICTSLDGAKLLTMLWIGSCDYQVHPIEFESIRTTGNYFQISVSINPVGSSIKRECGAIKRAVAGSFK